MFVKRCAWKIALSFFVCLLSVSYVDAGKVAIKGKKGDWYLEVDGRPFYVKGAGCGYAFGRDGEDYLRLAHELGANAVRTWGTDQGNAKYLDQAQKYGLKVAAGIWLNWVDKSGKYSYLTNEEYKRSKRQEVLSYVETYKKHPAILIWIVGNEAIFFTQDQREKIALCDFLDNLIQDIHKIDPDHPVAYASAGTTAFPYLADYVPSLDIIGVNQYGSIRSVQGKWEFQGFDKPYLMTEYGPYLSIDRPKDAHGCAVELSDENKAKRYKELAEQIQDFRGYSLGGFVFHLGETTQESMTWWNINEGMGKRPAFWVINELYTRRKSRYGDFARIKKLSLSKTDGIAPGETIEASVELEWGDPEKLTFEFCVSTARQDVLEYYVNHFVPVDVLGHGQKVVLRVPAEKGVYRVYCFVRDSAGNVVSSNKSIRVGS